MNLSALLSQPLVAFAMELDNEYEHRAVHRTTARRPGAPARRGPWLTSFAMYANCLQHLGATAITVRTLEALARSATNLDGMRRWGYIKLSPPPERPNSRRPADSWLVELTPAGHLARETWRPLPQLVEQRWQDRFGADALQLLRDALLEVNRGLDVAYPDFLPILGYGFFTRRRGAAVERPMPQASAAPLPADAPLTALLSRVLCGFAYDFEGGSSVSLAISANILRLLDAPGVRYRDLPQQSGVSKESIAMAMGILRKASLAEIETTTNKIIRLTASGLKAQRDALDLIAEVENRWAGHFGQQTMQRLRLALTRFCGNTQDGASLLLQGLKPYPDNWRASVAPLQTLPHFPMVLHRGGYPDGS